MQDELEKRGECGCVLISTRPPCIYRREPQPYLPYLNSQQLRLGSSICNPRNFQVHWQDICITNEYKLKRTLIFKLGTTDMIEQSKTHPFNLSKGVKIFLPRIMKKENKAVNFCFFYQILLKANKGIQLT